MKKLSLLNLVLLFAPFLVFAQNLPDVIPPSPEAASLGKFSELPVSHYTGLPNTSGTITDFKGGKKALPVSIDYHARGIKVEEIASRVGIGWALNAGGQITRQTRMKSDDGLYGYFSSSVVQDYASENLPNLLNTCCVSAYSGADEEDKFPDQFNVQVGSLSVKYIFDYRDFTPLTQKYDDIKVERHYSMTGKIEGFLVTDKDGYKYTFGGVDGDNSNQTITTQNLIFNSMGQYTQTHPDNVDDTYNAWLLNKIESPNGDFATFEYDSEFSYMYQRSYDEYNGGLDYVNLSSLVHSYQYQLKELRYNQSPLGYKKSVFEGNDYRQDVKGGSELNVI